MEVEKRSPTTDHGLGAPDISEENMSLQIQQATQLNEDAKLPGWQETTYDILKQYIDVPNVTNNEIRLSVFKVCKHRSWQEVATFVQNDMCLEFFNMALKYTLSEGQQHKSNNGFIDGSGIGYVKEYTKDLKVTLEKAFDAKYFHKCPRPLEYIRDTFKMDYTKIANYLHPGHFSFPAGHSTKFFTAIETLNNVFHLDTKCLRTLLIAAYVESHGRSGNLIHYPMDNSASIHFMSNSFKSLIQTL